MQMGFVRHPKQPSQRRPSRKVDVGMGFQLFLLLRSQGGVYHTQTARMSGNRLPRSLPACVLLCSLAYCGDVGSCPSLPRFLRRCASLGIVAPVHVVALPRKRKWRERGVGRGGGDYCDMSLKSRRLGGALRMYVFRNTEEHEKIVAGKGLDPSFFLRLEAKHLDKRE